MVSDREEQKQRDMRGRAKIQHRPYLRCGEADCADLAPDMPTARKSLLPRRLAPPRASWQNRLSGSVPAEL